MTRPVGYWSSSLNKSEKAFQTTYRDCLAVVWDVRILRPYLKGSPFTLRTDHEALKWIRDKGDATGMLARWCLRLNELEYDVMHRAGMKHQAAEVLLPLGTTEYDTSKVNDDPPNYVVERTSDAGKEEEAVE